MYVCTSSYMRIHTEAQLLALQYNGVCILCILASTTLASTSYYQEYYRHVHKNSTSILWICIRAYYFMHTPSQYSYSSQQLWQQAHILLHYAYYNILTCQVFYRFEKQIWNKISAGFNRIFKISKNGLTEPIKTKNNQLIL